MALRMAAGVMRSVGRGDGGDGDFGGAAAGGFGDAAAVGGDGGRGGGHGEGEAEGFDEAGHGAGGAHGTAGADGGAEAAGDEFGFGDVDLAGAMLRPEAAAVGAGAEDFAFVMADEHGAGGEDDGGEVGADGGHDLGGEVLVAAADEDDGVHGLRADHLFGVHGQRLRRNMEVGWAKDSAMEMVGKTMGSPPARRTPRLTDSMRSGTLPWQGL